MHFNRFLWHSELNNILNVKLKSGIEIAQKKTTHIDPMIYGVKLCYGALKYILKLLHLSFIWYV